MTKLLTTLSLMLTVLIGSTGVSYAEYVEASNPNQLIPNINAARSGFCENCYLKGAKFYNDDMTEAELTGSNLTKVRFVRTKLFKANFTDTLLINAQFERLDLRGANFEGANLVGADFLLVNLIGANFKGANLKGAKLDREGIRIARASGAINIPGSAVIVEKKPKPKANISNSPKITSTETADAKIKRLEAEAKRLKIQKLEQEIARLKGETNTPSQPVQQRQAPVRRVPVNTRRHYADEYSCSSDDQSCLDSFAKRYGDDTKNRAYWGNGTVTESQWWLTLKILMSRMTSSKFANKAGWIELMDYGLNLGREYDAGRLTKDQYWDLKLRGKATFDKLGEEQDSWNSRRTAGRFISAITGALTGHLDHMKKLQILNAQERATQRQSKRGFFKRSYNDGFNTVCIYDDMGSDFVMTIKTGICPL